MTTSYLEQIHIFQPQHFIISSLSQKTSVCINGQVGLLQPPFFCNHTKGDGGQSRGSIWRPDVTGQERFQDTVNKALAQLIVYNVAIMPFLQKSAYSKYSM